MFVLRLFRHSLCVAALGMAISGSPSSMPVVGQVIAPPSAHAIIGMPLTPFSYAGAARRTGRYILRRGTVYVVSLPTQCTFRTIHGYKVYACEGNVFYAYDKGRYVRVYFE